MKPQKRSWLYLPVLMSLALGAQAQEAAEQAEKPTPRTNRLMEEVVVTAQKREENSQDVPIAISAFSAEKLEAFGIEKTEDLGRITPGLTFTSTAGYTVIYLRGVGTDAFLPAADPSVPTYIDGVNVLSGEGVDNTIGKVARIEVLKGPQGTLFGRNSTGGAISIITPNPGDEFEGEINIDVGDYNKFNRNIFMSIPLLEGKPGITSLGLSIMGYKNSADSFFENSETDVGIIDEFSEGARAKLHWAFTDTLSLTLAGTYNNQSNLSSLAQENTRPSTLGGGGPEEPADREITHNVRGGSASITTLYAATFEWLTDWVDVKIIGSDQLIAVDFAQVDFDNSPDDAVRFDSSTQFSDQITYELQILSNENTWLSDKLTWVAGLYYINGEGGFPVLDFYADAGGIGAGLLGLGDIFDTLDGLGLDTGAPVNLVSGGLISTKSESAYFQATWTFAPWLDVTIGGRYQEEARDISDSRLAFRASPGAEETLLQSFTVPTLEETNFTPKISVQYRPTDDIQIYASASQGFKSPTYNTVNFFGPPDPVKAEEITAYELGIKSELLDGTLRLNAAVFRSEIDELLTALVSLTSGGVIRFDNAGQAVIDGAEFDFLWQPMPNWNPGLALSGGASYLEGEYTDYKNGAGYDDDTGLSFGPDSLTGDDSRDFTGNEVIRTPKLSSNLSVNQRLYTDDFGEFEIGVDYYFNSGYFMTAQNSEHYTQPQYELWNARLSYFYQPWGLSFTLYGSNIKDEEYYLSRFAQDFGRADTLAPPVTYGARLKWDFSNTFF